MNSNNDTNFKDELNEVKNHAREAARATLLAVRTGIDAAISFLEERRDDATSDNADSASTGATQEEATTSTTATAEPEGSIVPPSMPDDKPPGATA